MSTQKQELFNIIETLPDELSTTIIDYIEYVKFSYIVNNHVAPDSLIIKSKEDFIKKLEDGEKDIENGDVYSLEEAFSEINTIRKTKGT